MIKRCPTNRRLSHLMYPSVLLFLLVWVPPSDGIVSMMFLQPTPLGMRGFRSRLSPSSFASWAALGFPFSAFCRFLGEFTESLTRMLLRESTRWVYSSRAFYSDLLGSECRSELSCIHILRGVPCSLGIAASAVVPLARWHVVLTTPHCGV